MKKPATGKSVVAVPRPLQDVLNDRFDRLIFAPKVSSTDILLEILSSLHRVELHLRGSDTLVTEVMDETDAEVLGITVPPKKKPLTTAEIRSRRSKNRSEQ